MRFCLSFIVSIYCIGQFNTANAGIFVLKYKNKALLPSTIDSSIKVIGFNEFMKIVLLESSMEYHEIDSIIQSDFDENIEFFYENQSNNGMMFNSNQIISPIEINLPVALSLELTLLHSIQINRLVKYIYKTSDYKNIESIKNQLQYIYSNGSIFIDKIVSTSFQTNDTYFQNQFYLLNTGQFTGDAGIDINIVPAWEMNRNSEIVFVGIIDDGCENHPDLDGRVISGFTPGIEPPLNDGRPLTDDLTEGNFFGVEIPIGPDGHGQSVAGIISASHNDIGIAGINDNTIVVPAKLIFAGLSEFANININYISNVLEVFQFMISDSRIAVVNNSWAFSEKCVVEDVHVPVMEALENAATSGRQGRGTLLVFSSGNDEDGSVNSCVMLPAISPFVLSVGAVDNHGFAFNYSGKGPTLDVVAPSAAGHPSVPFYTTDRVGETGINSLLSSFFNLSDLDDLGYTKLFSGTSAAAPQVAGIASLMLGDNPDLEEWKVRCQIMATAKNFYSNYLPSRNDNVGYGLVDAYAAMAGMARNDVVLDGDSRLYQGTNYIESKNFIVEPGADVVFRCEKEIRLQDGFHAQGDFHAYIGDYECQLPEFESYGKKATSAGTSAPSDSHGQEAPRPATPVPSPTSEAHFVRFYPNPTDDYLTVDFVLDADAAVELEILNALSANVCPPESRSKMLRKGQNKLIVDLGLLPSGVYHVTMKVGEHRHTQKIVVL